VSERNTTLAARLWWALLPYAGCYGYRDADGGSEHWWMRFSVVPYMLWKLAGSVPGFAAFKPMPPVVCNCDYCRGVPGARFEP